MIDFMVIGLPRSATTWAANWLTTNYTFCLHDPLYTLHYTEWDNDKTQFPQTLPYSKFGVSCTGIWRWPEWVNKHPAKKIVVTRNIDEIQRDMEKLGLPLMPDNAEALLNSIDAPQFPYTDFFHPRSAANIWSKLIGGQGFCQYRHSLLCEFNVQPNFQKIEPNKEVTQKLYNELLMK